MSSVGIRHREGLSKAKLVFALVVVGAACWGVWWMLRPNAADLLADAKRELRYGNYEKAEQLSIAAIEHDRTLSTAWEVRFEAAGRLEKHAELLSIAKGLAETNKSRAAELLIETADPLVVKNRWALAMPMFEFAVEIAPDHIVARQRLVSLYVAQSRREDAAPHIVALLKRGEFSQQELMMLSQPADELVFDKLRDRIGETPDDPQLRIVAAALARLDNKPTRVLKLLEPVLKQLPSVATAQAMYGKALLDLRRWSDFDRWAGSLSNATLQSASVLYVIGLRYSRQGDHKSAARLLSDSIKRNPNEIPAYSQLARTFAALGEASAAEKLSAHGREMTALAHLSRKVEINKFDPALCLEAAERCLKLNRFWEAKSWAGLAARRGEYERQAKEIIRQCTGHLDDLVQLPEKFNPAQLVDASRYPLPDLQAAAKAARNASDSSTTSRMLTAADTPVRFADEASSRGIRFTFFGDPHKGARTRVFELTGGGVAVLDFDLDGHPDLYFTQASTWPVNAKYRDRLFRNRGDGSFEDVTDAAGLGDTDYSQGVAAGDFNSDGWPDLFVCNLGKNRLYGNNGDGTFADVTAASGLNSVEWSTSAAIVDLNADGHPDIYETNYLGPISLVEKPCPTEKCGPPQFPAAQDRLWLNLGNGRFRDLTETSGIKQRDGKGLGLIVCDFDQSGVPSVFVANDQVLNFFFRSTDKTAGIIEGVVVPQFREDAMAVGVAFDDDGKPQACMGVAADDIDGDGRIDLFITNFEHESNCLYRQVGPNRFRDQTRRFGLRDPSFAPLGFGTQFFDADLDGDSDVAIANGYVFLTNGNDGETAMRPQFLVNLGEKRGFAEVAPSALGGYFEKKYFGRSMAVLDWNRDGREDFVVSNLIEPSSLVTNRTETGHHYIAIRLVGTLSSRVPFGTTVTVEHAGGKQMRQLVAGNGYQCSNERQLVFGLGQSEKVDRLTVQWPVGKRQVFKDVTADSRYQMVQGYPAPLQLP